MSLYHSTFLYHKKKNISHLTFSTGKPNPCQTPANAGDCNNHQERWFYNSRNRKCETFIYSGCGANPNNFKSEKQCEYTCKIKQGEKLKAYIVKVYIYHAVVGSLYV